MRLGWSVRWAMLVLLSAGCMHQQPAAHEAAFCPGDVLWILNAAHIERTRDTKRIVDPDGNIAMPFLGAIHVQGLTPKETERLLEDMYAEGGFYTKYDLIVERATNPPPSATQAPRPSSDPR